MANEDLLTGIRGILRILSQEDLYGLMTTVTQGLLKQKKISREEAIEVIIKYTSDPLSILKRRVVTKDVLFTYLHNKNIKIDLPTTKDKLTEKLYELWKIPHGQYKPNKENRNTSNAPDESLSEVVNIMAQQFSQWFYEIMNHKECISPEHFYPDARLKVSIISNSSTVVEETELPDPVVKLLFKIKSEHDLLFNPNLNVEGVRGRLDPHGLVIIIVCGTLHSNDVCVGVFEQLFALVRDPSCENNWKIKRTELNLRSKCGSIETPNVESSELSSTFLKLTER